MMTIEERLERIESLLAALIERETVKDWYGVDEFARLVGRESFTVREYCRLGRLRAEKRQSGRGAHPAWVISHQELLRYRREGLLPLALRQGSERNTEPRRNGAQSGSEPNTAATA
jgi:predicted site-specific integrase-resolvase